MTQKEMFEGLLIFKKYDESSDEINWEHDIIYAGSTAPGDMDAEDVASLNDLGWDWDDLDECWSHLN